MQELNEQLQIVCQGLEELTVGLRHSKEFMDKDRLQEIEDDTEHLTWLIEEYKLARKTL